MDKAQVEKNNKTLLNIMFSMQNEEGWQKTEQITKQSISEYFADEKLSKVDKVFVVGHGTSLAGAKNAEYMLSKIANVNSRAVSAYEFSTYTEKYLKCTDNVLVLGLSSGGGTKSVANSLEKAKKAGALTMSITKSGEGAVTEFADYKISAFTEIEKINGVTAYSASHLFILYAVFELCVLLGKKRNYIDENGENYWKEQWCEVKKTMEHIPEFFEDAKKIYDKYSADNLHNLVVLGTGPNFGTAFEGALKICEFAWLFSACEELEDFAHGRFREMDEKLPLFIVSPHESTHLKTLDLLAGCKISKVPAFIFTENATEELKEMCENVFVMPAIKEECLTPFIYVFPLWFFGYHYKAEKNEAVGQRRFNLLATDINYNAYLAAKQK